MLFFQPYANPVCRIAHWIVRPFRQSKSHFRVGYSMVRDPQHVRSPFQFSEVTEIAWEGDIPLTPKVVSAREILLFKFPPSKVSLLIEEKKGETGCCEVVNLPAIRP